MKDNNAENSIGKFFCLSRFFWFGGIISLIRMILDFPVSSLGMINYLGLYLSVILLIIHRKEPLKRQFLDIFMFFIGIDLFSMLYIYAFYKFSYSADNIFFFLFWTFFWIVTGAVTAVWGFLAVKCRNKGLKVLYIIMLIPLVALIFLEFTEAVFETWSYIEDEYKRVHNITVLPYSGPSPKNKLAVILADLAGLIVCSVTYIKKKKPDTQTKGTF